jgi:thiol:disulfide interchange protein DsbC
MLKKILLLTLAASLSLFAATNKEIEEYKTSLFKNAKQAVIKSVKVVSRESMEGYSGWEAVILLVEFTIDRAGTKQTIKAPDMVFVKGDFLADDIVNLKKGKTLKESYRPKPDNEYYDSEHLVAGNKDAKNKILIFSDPLCPFCRDIVPDIIAAAAKHPNALAVYHYSFPLATIHPASEAIIKAEISQRGKVKNKAEFLTKLYKTDVEAAEMNEEKIAAKLSSELGVKITKADMNKKETLKEYDEETQKAYQLVIRGTPSVFINGELDTTKAKINQLLKEYK